MLTGLVYQLIGGAHAARRLAISHLVHPPRGDRRAADRGAGGVRPGAQPQQICRLGDHVRLVRRRHLPHQHGLFEPALHLRRRAERAAQRLRTARAASGSGAAVFAILLAVLRRHPAWCIAHLLWPRGTDLGAPGAAAADAAPRVGAPLLRSPASRRVAMAATGAYAYYNIKVLNRYETSDEQEKYQRGLRAQISEVRKAAAAVGHQRHAQRRSCIPKRAAGWSPTGATTSRTRPARRSATFMFARATATRIA